MTQNVNMHLTVVEVRTGTCIYYAM